MLLVSPVRLFAEAASMPSANAVPAVPVAEPVPQLAVGAFGLTVTASLTCAVLVLPLTSTSVAVAVSEKFTSFVVVTVRLDRFQLATLTEVLPAVARNVLP